MTHNEFENMVPRLRPLMVKVGRNFFGNKCDAEDVAQDALERLWKYCERLDAERNMEALAVMVAKNICVEKFKRRQNEAHEPPGYIAADETYSADAHIIAKETREKIDSAIERLSPREQQLVRQRYLDGHSAEEIAQQTGIPKPSVKSMLSAAKSKLINILKSQ